MKFSLSWLKTWLETEASLSVITETLSAIGLEVEHVENAAEMLAPFVIAEVIEAVQHPNADRLRACRVSVGGVELSVVCGAPNARSGMKAVFAPPGAFIPGTGIRLKVGEIRGVKSEGMLVSKRELNLGEDHDGIIELPEDAPVGAIYANWAGLDDPVIDISVTPNRGDALSVCGVARDLAAAGLGSLKAFKPAAIAGSGLSRVTWHNAYTDACPWVLGRTISGVANGESPDWLKARLTSIGLRPINALVDITNFFTIDLGRPLHVFDVDKVSGNVLTLRHGNGESFTGLHGKQVTVLAEDCVIADVAGVQSLAGIVGGEATGCDFSTRNVFIECAVFDRVYIAQAGQRHAIHSDARQRFERGVDLALPPAALDAATEMVMQLCGGQASVVVEAGKEPIWRRKASLRFSRLKSFGGADIAPDEAMASLEKLGFSIYRRDGEHVVMDVPSWRNDIAQISTLDQSLSLDAAIAAEAAAGAAVIEPEVDLIEEVLRMRGLDAIAPESLPRTMSIPAPILTPKQTRTALARRVLAGRGLMECVTFSFLKHATAALFSEAPEALRLENPIAADLDQMRPTAVATLVTAAARNIARGYSDLGLFEIGPIYPAAEGQILAAAGLRTGETPLSAVARTRKFDALDAKADALAVLGALGVPLDAISATPDAPTYFHPGQSGVLRQGPGITLGYFGRCIRRFAASLTCQTERWRSNCFLTPFLNPSAAKKPLQCCLHFSPYAVTLRFWCPRQR